MNLMTRVLFRTQDCFWLLLVFASFAHAQDSAPAPARPATSVLGTGYLSPGAMPTSVSFVPEPPFAGSASMLRDEEMNRRALAANGTPRWELAMRDAALTIPAVAQAFSCALNLQISEEKTPRVVLLMRRTLSDAGRSTSDAKDRYKRIRPFVVNGKPSCTPAQENMLRTNSSYPSGHAAIGFALGLVLSEIAPDQTSALVARGRAFGESRVVCNVHWQSDVDEGQLVGSALVARLHAEPEFRSDVAAARTELEALRAQSSKPEVASCAADFRALESWKQ
jgi:acid phosphatase (class A)